MIRSVAGSVPTNAVVQSPQLRLRQLQLRRTVRSLAGDALWVIGLLALAAVAVGGLMGLLAG